MDLKQLYRKLLKRESEPQQLIYRNLVFKGGGVRGIAYMGAIEVLDELGVLKDVRRVAGTSAGAIAATMISFGLDIPATWGLFGTLDAPRVAQSVLLGKERRLRQAEDIDCYRRLRNKFGWYASEYLHLWLQDTIASQCEGNGRATFAEFQERGFRELYIAASNVSRHRAEVFSATTTPNVAVADAVRMSASIPIYFEALRFDGEKFGDGDYYADGGLYDNFPMHIFDRPAFAATSQAYRDGANWETLGLFLFPEKLRTPGEPELPETVWQFLTLALHNLSYAQQISGYQTNPVDRQRSIEISDCGISPVDFDIAPGSDKFVRLLTSGQQAVRTFFAQYERESSG